MKIKAIRQSYDSVINEHEVKKHKHVKPLRPSVFFRTLMKLVSIPDLSATDFKYEKIGMERLGKNQHAFYIMNHSSFIDLEIVATVLYPRPYNIVTSNDGFIGKDWLMRHLGCIPTKKFCADTTMVRDMLHVAKSKNSSLVMFPEAGYSFDGTCTTLPSTLGKCVKMLGMPLVMIKSYGAFSRDPLYNNLQKRKVQVTATMEYLLSQEEIADMPAEEIDEIIKKQFTFDSFKWQRDNKIKISEPFRADGLDRVLYKCPHCGSEGKTLGSGIDLECLECGVKYTLDEYGSLYREDGEAAFTHVPDWYAWERSEVRREIEAGEYSFDVPVKIWVSVDTKKMYDVGEGRLRHDSCGFVLTSDDGELHYEHKPLSSHSICADFNFYEEGDVIALSGTQCVYYCFPKDASIPVAKARLAAEELYKISSDHLHRS